MSLFDRYERHSLKTENEALKAQLQALTERMEQRNSAGASRAPPTPRGSDDLPPAGGGAVDTAPQLPTPSADSTAGRPKRGGGALSVVEVLPNAATTTVGTAAAGNPADPATHKYRLTKELVRARCDKYNIILVTFVNAKRADYAYTWASHVQRLNLTNYLVGAMDTTALGLLNGRGIPAFDMESGLTTADFGWGTKNSQLGLRKTELIVALLRAGADPILTDADALITRDPTPFVAPLLPEADILVTSDHLMSTTTDDGLELPEHAAVSKWNIGYFYIRHTALKAIVHWQQMCAADRRPPTRAASPTSPPPLASPTHLAFSHLPRRARSGAPTTRRCGTRTCSRTSSRSAGCGSARDGVPEALVKKRLFLGYNGTMAVILPVATFLLGPHLLRPEDAAGGGRATRRAIRRATRAPGAQCGAMPDAAQRRSAAASSRTRCTPPSSTRAPGKLHRLREAQLARRAIVLQSQRRCARVHADGAPRAREAELRRRPVARAGAACTSSRTSRWSTSSSCRRRPRDSAQLGAPFGRAIGAILSDATPHSFAADPRRPPPRREAQARAGAAADRLRPRPVLGAA